MWGGRSSLLKMAVRPTARSAAVGRWLRCGKGRRGGKRDEERNLGAVARLLASFVSSSSSSTALTLRIPFRQRCAASSFGGASCKRASISGPSFRDCFSCFGSLHSSISNLYAPEPQTTKMRKPRMMGPTGYAASFLRCTSRKRRGERKTRRYHLVNADHH